MTDIKEASLEREAAFSAASDKTTAPATMGFRFGWRSSSVGQGTYSKGGNMNIRAIGRAMLAAGLAGPGVSMVIAAEPVQTVTVDCNRGETVAKALSQGDERKPLVVVVKGACNESVNVSRNDVTLRGESGGAISGPDPDVDTLTVMANRVTIQEISIGGGRNGITGIGAAALVVRDTTVQSTGRTGIIYSNGSSGVIDRCTVRLNPRDGVVVETASAAIINSDISQNLRGGIFVGIGGAARIGLDPRNQGAGNTVNQNGATGVTVVDGGQALMGMNEINGNGTDPTTTAGRFGIFVRGGNVDLAGGNTISGHPLQGILAINSPILIGNTAVGISSVNTITGNGTAVPTGGIFATLGSALTIRDAVISNNSGPGLALSLRSQGQLFGSTIQGNSGDGIVLSLGSALLPSPPTTTVSGNAGFGIQCADPESSVLNTFPPFMSFSGNGGEVSPGCTPFF